MYDSTAPFHNTTSFSFLWTANTLHSFWKLVCSILMTEKVFCNWRTEKYSDEFSSLSRDFILSCCGLHFGWKKFQKRMAGSLFTSKDWQNTRELCVQGNWAAEYLCNQWLRIKDSCCIARCCYLQDHCLHICSTWIVCWTSTFFAILMNRRLHTDIHSNNWFLFLHVYKHHKSNLSCSWAALNHNFLKLYKTMSLRKFHQF